MTTTEEDLCAKPLGRSYNSKVKTIGNTPLVRINRLAEEYGCVADVFAKLEFFNPLYSVKDRIAVSMIEAMEADGTVGPGSIIVEPRAGNTGIGLAFVCAARGYRCIRVVPDSFSTERRKLIRLLGAELVLTPKEQGLNGATAKAEEIVATNDKAVMLFSSAIRPIPAFTANQAPRKSGTTPPDRWMQGGDRFRHRRCAHRHCRASPRHLVGLLVAARPERLHSCHVGTPAEGYSPPEAVPAGSGPVRDRLDISVGAMPALFGAVTSATIALVMLPRELRDRGLLPRPHIRTPA